MTIEEMLDACDAIKDARDVLKGQVKMVPQQAPDLKVYLAMVSWDGQTSPNLEMTILGITKQSAEDKVRELLDDDGYDTDDTNFRLYLKEVVGPFKAGFVIAKCCY